MSVRAFSITGLLLSLLLMSAIIVAAVKWQRSISKVSHQSTTTIKINSELLVLQKALESDFGAVVYVNEAANHDELNINNEKIPAFGISFSDQKNELDLFLESNIAFQAPLVMASNSAEIDYQLLKDSRSYQSGTKGYFSKQLTNSPFAVISNASLSRLVQISNLDSNKKTFQYFPDISTDLLSSGGFFLRGLDLVRYSLKDGQLIREKGASTLSVAKNIKDLKWSFKFTQRSDDPKDIVIPVGYQSAQDLQSLQSTCGNPGQGSCWTWRNLNSLKIDIQAGDLDEQSIEFFPSSHQNPGAVEVNLANSSCTPSVANRCKTDCANTFTSNDPDSPFYRDYGDLNSAYCKCGGADGKSDFVNPELSHPPAWNQNDESTQDRWRACGEVFGCVNWVKQGNPEFGLACGCLQDKSKMSMVDYDSSKHSYKLSENFSQVLNDLGNNSYKDNNLRCSEYTSCQAKIDTLKSPSNKKIWLNYCSCRTMETDYSGKARYPIYGGQLDFQSLCHAEGADYQCDNTRTQTGPNPDDFQWILQDTNYLEGQGLSVSQVHLCNCLNTKFENKYERRSRTWDFRTPRPTGSGICPDGEISQSCSSDGSPNADTYGIISTPESSSMTVQKNTGFNSYEDFKINSLSCGQSYCNSVPGSLGCITRGNVNANVLDQYKDYAGYCRDDLWGLGSFSKEVDEIRNIITDGKGCFSVPQGDPQL